MNRCLNIIPTPKFCTYTSGKPFSFEKVCIDGKSSDILKNALDILSSENKISYTDAENADLVIYSDFEKLPDGIFSESELSIFCEKFAKEQGYVLKYTEEGKIIVASYSAQGAAYAVMTLMQIIGKEVGSFTICDAPDFRYRGVEWLIWAETGCWAYDFGDGKDAIIERMLRKIDMLFKFKINYVHADGFGFDADRFPGYSEIMQTVSDAARKRGIKFAAGGYAMSYGCSGFRNSYQGKVFQNRRSYPDGEIYECIGTFNKDDKEVTARTHGTCMSNEALLEEKLKELTEFVKKTHITSIYFHNMDSCELFQDFWLARCEDCKKRWPNDSLYAKDGAAGAFAEYFDKIYKRLAAVKDGDYDASKDLMMHVVSPGYQYEWRLDEDFDNGVKFWSAFCDYLEEKENITICLREQFFYHEKNIERAKFVAENFKGAKIAVVNFNGCDGFYDDKLFNVTSSLNYIQKGFDNHYIYNGHAYQEPLAVFDAEYLWNSENSAFYNVPNKPDNYNDFAKLYEDMKQSKIRPEEVYGEGGFIDVACEKLYGKKMGKPLAKIYKLGGKNGEPPVACASCVDVFTQFSKIVIPMRWDVEMKPEDIDAKIERFRECRIVTKQAYDILSAAMDDFEGDDGMKSDLTWFLDCFKMGSMMTKLLDEYMNLYKELNDCFVNNYEVTDSIKETFKDIKNEAGVFYDYIYSSDAKPLDRFGGSHIRRQEMADFFIYNTKIMGYSIEQKKRMPDGIDELPKAKWW